MFRQDSLGDGVPWCFICPALHFALSTHQMVQSSSSFVNGSVLDIDTLDERRAVAGPPALARASTNSAERCRDRRTPHAGRKRWARRGFRGTVPCGIHFLGQAHLTLRGRPEPTERLRSNCMVGSGAARCVAPALRLRLARFGRPVR